MTFSISGAVSDQLSYAYATTPVINQPAPQQPQQPQEAEDTVVLSQTAQVNDLKLQGQSPTEIADALGISVSDVNSDLGITAASTASAATPAAVAPAASTPAPAAAPAATSTQTSSAVSAK